MSAYFACFASSAAAISKELFGRFRHFRADLSTEFVDQTQALLGFHVPEGPAVAGFEALSERSDAVDRADGPVERYRAICAHQRLVPLLGIDQPCAGCDKPALDQRCKRNARRFPCRHKRRKCWSFERFDLGDTLAGRFGVFCILLASDKAPSKTFGDRASRAGTAKWIQHQIVRPRARQDHAREQRLRLLCRMQLLAIAALEPLFAGA